jgi:hypothetical protein
MIRIAQFSDLHYSEKNLAEADRCFGFAVDESIRRGAEVAVISGDSTDHALDVHSPAVERLARQVRRLADHCPVLMLQGTFSHEPPGTLAIFRLLGGRYGVHVADRIGQVALRLDRTWVGSQGWRFDGAQDQLPDGARVLFTCVPTVNKATVAASVGAADAGVALGQELAALLAGFAASNQAAREALVPTVGVSHGTVTGCITEHDVPMAGFDHEFTSGALFSAQAQAFMLGHIHRHQHWEQGGRIVAYAGSIGRFHHGEVGDKGFVLWEVAPRRWRSSWCRPPRGGPSTCSSRASPTWRGSSRQWRLVTWKVPGSACAGRSPTRIGTRSTARPSSARWQVRQACNWKGGSCPSCAAGQKASRDAQAWATRCAHGPGSRAPGWSRCWRTWSASRTRRPSRSPVRC